MRAGRIGGLVARLRTLPAGARLLRHAVVDVARYAVARFETIESPAPDAQIQLIEAKRRVAVCMADARAAAPDAKKALHPIEVWSRKLELERAEGDADLVREAEARLAAHQQHAARKAGEAAIRKRDADALESELCRTILSIEEARVSKNRRDALRALRRTRAAAGRALRHMANEPKADAD